MCESSIDNSAEPCSDQLSLSPMHWLKSPSGGLGTATRSDQWENAADCASGTGDITNNTIVETTLYTESH